MAWVRKQAFTPKPHLRPDECKGDVPTTAICTFLLFREILHNRAGDLIPCRRLGDSKNENLDWTHRTAGRDGCCSSTRTMIEVGKTHVCSNWITSIARSRVAEDATDIDTPVAANSI